MLVTLFRVRANAVHGCAARTLQPIEYAPRAALIRLENVSATASLGFEDDLEDFENTFVARLRSSPSINIGRMQLPQTYQSFTRCTPRTSDAILKPESGSSAT